MKTLNSSLLAVALLILTACAGGLPSSLRRNIAYEHDRMQDAEHEVARAESMVKEDLAKDPDLFRNAAAPAKWATELQTAREKLAGMKPTDRELVELARQDSADSSPRAERLLAEERSVLLRVIEQSKSVENEAAKWVSFKRDLPSNLAKMERDFEAVRAADLGPVTAAVEQAGHDWPAKKNTLEARLGAVKAIPTSAASLWSETASARQSAAAATASSAQLATLIEASDVLANDASSIRAKTDDLRALSGQLYDSWDKVLIDLDAADQGRDRIFRERIKTVKTHFDDMAAKHTETASSEQWIDVPEPSFRAVENDLGMTLAHKDAGEFDFEAQTTPQPAGFAYVAPESQRSNQYGYWDHAGGESVWTWLPQYLLLRELLWNHSYRPVMLNEYRGFQMTQQSGRTYYGRETPASPPKYGTHGSFTQTSYAKSRYVQSGGFNGSAYASHNTNGTHANFEASRANEHGNTGWSDKSAGRRFGTAASGASGKRFGPSGGFRAGRSFGRRR